MRTAMKTAGKVVAVLPVSYFTHKTENVVAARVRGFGLTAYGKTKDEAKANVVRMFKKYVELHRERGTLEVKLSKSGVAWCWEKDIQGKISDLKIGSFYDNLPCKTTAEPNWEQSGILAAA